MKKILFFIFCINFYCSVNAEDGYDLWLRYKPVENKNLLTSYRSLLKQINIYGNSSTISIIKDELLNASKGMLGQQPAFISSHTKFGGLVIVNLLSLSKEDISTEAIVKKM